MPSLDLKIAIAKAALTWYKAGQSREDFLANLRDLGANRASLNFAAQYWDRLVMCRLCDALASPRVS
jgi:hypothetical protein